jgi:5-methyltetrahydrofolate--homocysteine methyltransferase
MTRLLDRLRAGEIPICDGAMGTLLMAHGLEAGECPEAWCTTHPDVVLNIASAYVSAGADIVGTNSFGGNAYKLSAYGLAGNCAEINRAAAALAKRAIGANGYVAASVGPSGRFVLEEGGQTPAADLYDAFARQAAALEEGGADAICIETMWSIREAEQAIRAVKRNTSLPAICTFTFNAGAKGYRTAAGVTPQRAALAALEAGADVVGANCGNGIDEMVEIAGMIRDAAPRALILIQANAGLPAIENGETVYKQTPEYMASRVPGLIAAGANVIGGCCGTTPAHIAAIRAAVHALADPRI